MNTCCHAMMSGAEQSQVASGQMLCIKGNDWHLSWRVQHCSNVMSFGLHRRNESFFFCDEDEKKMFGTEEKALWGVCETPRWAGSSHKILHRWGGQVDGGGVLGHAALKKKKKKKSHSHPCRRKTRLLLWVQPVIDTPFNFSYHSQSWMSLMKSKKYLDHPHVSDSAFTSVGQEHSLAQINGSGMSNV